ncbi:ATP-dependent RNA helicase DDX3X [Nematocida major]|uniref:ATP-dependent RNA helicase DDX3X n=1 Tax=Nematocida major TaxID=1912982 RepID=UPI002008E41A|nr:ATP-dependent RNA helicase DDX3X [Nematocida major]KAH9386690.1 ATP-dependent RNA helicase DDX3X [Nematocida major]
MNANNYMPPPMSKKGEAPNRKQAEEVTTKGIENLNPIQSFKGQLISAKILENMENMKIDTPTLVQKYVMPLALHGKDMLISAPTGMGKTISFLVPVLNTLVGAKSLEKREKSSKYSQMYKGGHGKRTIKALILTPTRELALQIHSETELLSKGMSISAGCVYGGVYRSDQKADIRRGLDLVIGTPGRILDFIKDATVNFDLSAVQMLVFDEADRMLDMGFEKQIREILQHLSPEMSRQTMMFSATFPAPVRALAKEFFQKVPVEVHVGHGLLEKIKQELVFVEEPDHYKQEKNEKLMSLLQEYGYTPSDPIEMAQSRNSMFGRGGGHSTPNLTWAHKKKDAEPKKEIKEREQPEKKQHKIVIFVDQKVECNSLSQHLHRNGISCTSIHGDKSQQERESSLGDFKSGALPVLIATSVAARGLDIPGISLVVNYSMPSDINDYVHRIGRTGRAGRSGRAVTFIGRGSAHQAADLIEILEKAKQTVPAFLAEMLSFKGGRGGKGNSRSMSSSTYRKKEDSGQHFQITREIKHKEVPVLSKKIEIQRNMSWENDI